MLLQRPHWDAARGDWTDDSRVHVETCNDLDGSVTNFWRAVQHDPEQVAEYADNPVHELDLHARHLWLNRRFLDTEGLSESALAYASDKKVLPFAARLTLDPEWYDARAAGWWCWGLSSWIGDNWARPKCNARPHLSRGQGVNRKRPHLGNAGRGVNRQLPHLGDAGRGAVAHHRAALIEWFSALADRLRNVSVCCGDWERICGNSPTENRARPCAVFFDPPYSQDHGLDTVYGEYHDNTVAARVRHWCIERGQSSDLRIALCGYDTEHGELEKHGWSVLAWKAAGGYGRQGQDSRGQANAHRERIWFSPHCLGEERGGTLFDEGIADA